ncbi:MAG TPA: low molecular weight protein-tyrosine-phosphatase [Rhodocyclaceae bacterium]|nr:low molecular weight protein-tyrosine-phosphatase [Rhodocyclaceae bacterium]
MLFSRLWHSDHEADQAGWRILFVCMGNICRSPLAEGVFRQRVEEAGLSHLLVCDSAGTRAAHAGEPPDMRAQTVARKAGIELAQLRARRATEADFAAFDWILAMDRSNLGDLLRECPPQYRHKVHLMLEFAGEGADEVPDPYYGGIEGFQEVLARCERGAHGVIRRFRAMQLDVDEGRRGARQSSD